MNPASAMTIIGAGAIGGWVAARLALSGADVSVVARGETLRAIGADGLKITEAGETSSVDVAVTDDPATLGEQQIVVLAVKAPALADAALAARQLIGAETAILPMLNGVPWWFTGDRLACVDPNGAIAASIPVEQVIGGVVHASCYREAPNHVVVKHSDKILIGEPQGGTSERIARLFGLLDHAGLRPDRTGNIRRAIWYKLWGNATINPLSALTRSTADKLLDDPAIRGLMAEAMDELAAIGAAIGCPIEESAEDRMAVTARLGAFKSSMLQDVEAGRPIELESLLGAPREIAGTVGVPTPQLDRIYAMTRLMGKNLGLL
ncbi:MAG TPA: 2-dehydropantoate 2-reductase [Sphingomicrobium sp.]|nr:2-dehydropantoate 2-reductase [Sphingomicrobium sp.]